MTQRKVSRKETRAKVLHKQAPRPGLRQDSIHKLPCFNRKWDKESSRKRHKDSSHKRHQESSRKQHKDSSHKRHTEHRHNSTSKIRTINTERRLKGHHRRHRRRKRHHKLPHHILRLLSRHRWT